MALLILALLQRIFLMSSLMLLLVWLIFFMVLIKLLPILGTISGKTVVLMFFFSSRRRNTRCLSDWSSDVCSSDLLGVGRFLRDMTEQARAQQRQLIIHTAAAEAKFNLPNRKNFTPLLSRPLPYYEELVDRKSVV